MKRTVTSVLVFLLTALLAGAVLPAQFILTPQVAAQLPTASPDALLRHARALSNDIGTRPAGGNGYRQAVEYMERELRSLGYRVERQAFTFRYFEARRVALRQLLEGQGLAAAALHYSPSTPSQGIDAPLVQAALGRPDDLEPAQVSGRIALMERGGTGPQGERLTFRAKVDNAAAAGAVAAVIYNDQAGSIPSGTLGSPTRIPAVAISREDGERLIAAIGQREVRVQLIVETILEDRTTWNVIGRRAGRDARTVVVGAHLDSVPESPGANDNASGVAAALEAARLLAALPLEASIEIIGFGGEEIGLLGSTHYVQDRGRSVAAMVNLDMVGRGPLGVGNLGPNDALVDRAVAAARRLGFTVERFRFGSSDHVPFERALVPVVFINTGNDSEQHRPGDVVERLDAQRMAQAAQLAATVAAEAAGQQ